MTEPAAQPKAPRGAVVTARSLTAAPSIVGKPLAEPWRRLGGMLVDLAMIGLLSLLSGPWLGLGTGAMLVVLFGSDRTAPFPKKLIRWACRGLGTTIVVLAILALGHAPFLRKGGLHFDAFIGGTKSAAPVERIWVSPDASANELRNVTDRLQKQVERLRDDNEEQRRASSSWAYQARTFANALGVTFGWSGVYFTLLPGSWRGRSVGKFLFRTLPVKTDGTAFTYFDAFVRHGGYVAGVAMGLTGFFKLLWEPNRQAVEDRIAGTVVLDVERLP